MVSTRKPWAYCRTLQRPGAKEQTYGQKPLCDSGTGRASFSDLHGHQLASGLDGSHAPAWELCWTLQRPWWKVRIGWKDQDVSASRGWEIDPWL